MLKVRVCRANRSRYQRFPSFNSDHRRYGLFVSVGLVVSLLLSAPASADISKRKFNVRWQESGNRIDLRSVCYTYPDGSIEYRRCRVQAQALFRQRCREYKADYERAKPGYKKSLRKKRDKFCAAYDRYSPI